MGVVATKRPPTVRLRAFQAPADGHAASPGKALQELDGDWRGTSPSAGERRDSERRNDLANMATTIKSTKEAQIPM